MKEFTKHAKRILALVLVFGLLMSNMAGLSLTASAAGEATVGYGKIMADNYELTAAEEDLLSSGLIAGGSVTYTAPTGSDGLVSVDADEKTITATEPGDWKATSADIVVDGSSVETVSLTDGKAKYAYTGNAFTVEVYYVLNAEISADEQNSMLGTMANLKQGVNNMQAAYDGSDANLGTVVLAMDILSQLADGISLGWASAQFGAEAIAAVEALEAEIAANTDKLALQVQNAAYSASASKVQYLIENGAAYNNVVISTHNNLAAISADPLMNNDLLDSYLKSQQPSDYTQWMALKGIIKNLVAALEPVADAWPVVEAGELRENVNYATLDTYVAALPNVATAIAVTSPLKVAETEVAINKAMWNVIVKVELLAVEDKADSAVLEEADSVTVNLTLLEATTKDELFDAIMMAVFEETSGWDTVNYAADLIALDAALPEILVKDFEYTLTYKPIDCTLDISDYGDAMTVPYGYQYTLPKHSDATKAYDYTVNGTAYAQGKIVTIEGNTIITRTAGKSYTSTDLYTIVADNFGNAAAQAILKSGALKDNTVINFREPDPADAESLLKLEDGVLTAKDAYASDYEKLDWIPFTYGAEGTENYFASDDYEVEWTGDSAKVQYVLEFTNFGQAGAQDILDLAKTLKADAADQKGAMDNLLGLKDTLVQLDKTKLGALNGVIDVTDFDADPVENDRIRAELKSVVSAIIANNLDANNKLKLYNMVAVYENDGLNYYYKNYAAIRSEVERLSGYLGNLMDNEEALRIMCNAAGYGEYADKISDVEGKLNTYLNMMTAPNAAIDVESDNLGKLVTALTAEGSAECSASGSPYALSKVLTAMDASKVMVQVVIETSKGGATVTTAEMDKDTVLDKTAADKLEAAVTAKVAELLGDNAKYYALSADKTVDSLVGTEIAKTTTIYYTYTAKEYTVKIDGEADQKVTIEDLEINLPKHPTNGWTYTYTVDGAEITATTYTFTADQLDRLFVVGVYTITREASNEAEEDFEEAFGEWIVRDEQSNVTGLNANLAGMGEIMDLAMTFVKSGYSYIALNEEPFMYLTDENVLEICMQTLINAILADDNFGSDTIVALGENGKGKLLTAKLDLGNSKDDILYSELDFVVNLNSVPSQLTDNVELLKKAFNYVSFQSHDGALDVSVTLPEQVYAAYAAALITSGYYEKNQVNDIDQAVAMQFLMEYVDALIASGADMETFTNTLAKLGQNKDLTAYNKYYKGAVSGYQKYVTVDAATGAVDIAVPGQKTIDALMNFAGVDTASMSTYLNMLKEYKAGGEITANGNVKLENLEKEYLALIVDAQASGVSNKVQAPSSVEDLQGELKALAGYSAVILTADVEGELTIAGTTVLDLNGFNVNGAINATGTLYIVDSSMDTAAAGTVSGAVTGNVSVFGGSYKQGLPASALKDGYKLVGENVQNALYTISEDNGNVTFNLNSDVIDETIDSYTAFAKAVAVDLAADIVLNYYTAAALTAGDDEIYDINVEDLIAVLEESSKVNAAIDIVLGSVNVPNIGEFVETVINDMLDFEAVNAALVAGNPVATYTLTTAPWQIELGTADEDYLKVGVSANDAMAKSFSVSVVVGGANVDRIIDLTSQLADIKAKGDVDIVLEEVERNGNTIPVKGSIVVNVSADLTASDKHEAYIKAIAAVIGDDELIAALKANPDDVNAEAVQKAFNAITVKEIFDAAKALNRNDTFAAKAKAAGLTYDAADLAELEAAYKLVVCAAGKALEKLEITGPSAVMGGFTDGEGAYTYEKNNVNRTPSFSVRGYTVAADLTASGSVELTIFGEAKTPVVPGCNHVYGEPVFDWKGVDSATATFTCTNGCGHKEVVDCTITSSTTAGDCKNRAETVYTATAPFYGNTYTDTKIVYGSFGGHVDADKNLYCDVCGAFLGNPGVITPPVDENGCAHYNKNCGVECHVELYKDLSADKWYHEYIDYVVCRGLMIGIEEDVFAPSMTTTRAMIVTTLYRIENCPEVKFEQHYEDVAEGLWYSDAIAWATENGIVNGYGDGTFGPRNVVTREQMAAILYRYIDYKGFNVDVEYDLGDYKDAGDVHAWAKDAMEWAVGIGMINGISETEMVLDPLGGTARSHVAALLTRMCVNFEL